MVWALGSWSLTQNQLRWARKLTLKKCFLLLYYSMCQTCISHKNLSSFLAHKNSSRSKNSALNNWAVFPNTLNLLGTWSSMIPYGGFSNSRISKKPWFSMRLNGLMILMTGWFWGTMTSETAMTSVNRSHCPGPHAGCLWAGRPGSKTPTSCHLPGTEGRSPKFLLTPWRIRMDGMFRAAWWSVSWWLGQRIQREGKVDRKTRLVKKNTTVQHYCTLKFTSATCIEPPGPQSMKYHWKNNLYSHGVWGFSPCGSALHGVLQMPGFQTSAFKWGLINL